MKILIIAPSWIGDGVISHTMYQLLLKNNPKTKIDILAPIWNQALFHRMPEIKKVLPLTHFQHGSFPLKKYYQFGKSLIKTQKYQQSIILPNSFKSALIPFFANIPKRTGWKGEMRYGLLNDIRILKPKNFPSMIQRYAALAFEKQKMKNFNDLPHPLPWPYLHCTLQEINIILKKFNIKNNLKQKKIIGICPGSGCNLLKCWPATHYAELTLQLIQEEYQVILLGSYKEKIIGKIIIHNLPKNLHIYCHNLIGLTSLDEAILIIKKCNAIISNDSGLMHIACALQRPVIALYGPSNPNFTPPLYHYIKIIKLNNQKNNKYKNMILRKKYYQNKYHESLINIYPKNVFKELQILLKYYEKN